MISTIPKTIVFTLALTLCVTFSAQAASPDAAPATKNGKPWRIAYYEGGPYIDYQRSLVAMIQGFMALGWIREAPLPGLKGSETAGLWAWLATEAQSAYLIFPADAHYSAKWDKALRPKMTAEVIQRLNEKGDIDLIIASGTAAGKALANNKHNIPTLVISTSAPIKAGIIKSVADSGLDHVHARVDPFRYKRQVSIFHDIIQFKRLGIAYEDSKEGRTYGAIDQVEAVAQERGFELVRCATNSDVKDKSEAAESVKGCFENFSQQNVEAIYITLQIGVNKNSIANLVAIANAHKIPTFSQSGSREVKAGVLLSLSKASFEPVGLFYAETVGKIFNGAKPRDLSQLFEAAPRIAINLKTADEVGIIDHLPLSLMRTADEVFQTIESP